MSIKKQYLKSKPVCKVTFRLPRQRAAGARKAALAGEFNDWKVDRTPMKALKNGDFTVTLNLKTGQEYQYRYIVDNQGWITDDGADKYVHSGFADCQNSVVVI